MASARTSASELVAPLNKGGSSYEGFLCVQAGGVNHYFWLRISGVPPGVGAECGHGSSDAGVGLLDSARLECGRDLHQLLEGHEDLVAARLRGSHSVDACLGELRDVVETLCMHRQSHVPPAVSFYAQLVAELDSIGWDAVAWMSPDCSALLLQHTDTAGRLHQLRMDLPPGYPAVPPTVMADLPEPFTLTAQHIPAAGGPHQGDDARGGGEGGGSVAAFGVRAVLRQWQQAVAAYQDLWDCLEDFDAHAWVLQPAPPPPRPGATIGVAAARASGAEEDAAAEGAGEGEPPRPYPGACAYRRLALGQKHCSVSVRLSPHTPRGVPPDVQFLGAPASIAPLQRRFFDGLDGWDEARLPRLNLEALLGEPLPRRAAAAEAGATGGQMEDDTCADCAICYSYLLLPEESGGGGGGGGGDHAMHEANEMMEGGEAPSASCPNPSCGRAFHRRCLGDWLRALPTTSAVYDTLFGICPYCSEPICVKAA